MANPFYARGFTAAPGVFVKSVDYNSEQNLVLNGFEAVYVDTKRAIKVPADVVTDQVIVGDASARASRAVGFDGSGNLALLSLASIASVNFSGVTSADTLTPTAAEFNSLSGMTAGTVLTTGDLASTILEFNQPSIWEVAGSSYVEFRDTTQPTNEKRWRVGALSGDFFIQTRGDNGATGETALAVQNSNAAIVQCVVNGGVLLNLTGTTVNINGSTAWHAGNDGAASGLDADLLDGLQANDILAFAEDVDNHISGATNKVFTATEQTKLAGIETGATADQSAAEILSALLSVDGAGSGLDADLLDGSQLSELGRLSVASTWTAKQTFNNNDGFDIRLLSTLPAMEMVESDATADNQVWALIVGGEQLGWYARNDAQTVSTAFMTVDRTGTTIDSVALAGASVTINGVEALPAVANWSTTATADRLDAGSIRLATDSTAGRLVIHNDHGSGTLEYAYTINGTAASGQLAAAGSHNIALSAGHFDLIVSMTDASEQVHVSAVVASNVVLGIARTLN